MNMMILQLFGKHWLILIASGLLFAVYHYVRVERLVTVRTSELFSSNQALEKEIVEHTQSEQEAHTYRDHMQLLMDSLNLFNSQYTFNHVSFLYNR